MAISRLEIATQILCSKQWVLNRSDIKSVKYSLELADMLIEEETNSERVLPKNRKDKSDVDDTPVKPKPGE